MTTLVQHQYCKGKLNNYLVGGNLCNAFALGELGSNDEFFLLGSEPVGESNNPLLTGNILDSEGNVLFRLVRNMLVGSAGKCKKILSDRIGYEIHDEHGEIVFGVQTVLERLPDSNEECFVTTVSGTFFNKNGELVLAANSESEFEQIGSNVKAIFGLEGEFGYTQGFNNDEKRIARLMFGTGGKINKLIKGHVTNQEFSLDGAVALNATIENCKIYVTTGEFLLLGTTMTGCNILFDGPALSIRNLLESAKS